MYFELVKVVKTSEKYIDDGHVYKVTNIKIIWMLSKSWTTQK